MSAAPPSVDVHLNSLLWAQPGYNLLRIRERMETLRIAISALLFIASFGCAPEQATDSRATRPNVLWLIGEDLGPELGAYGHPEVRTPNLDRLAAEGVRYTHAFTTAPVCSPSRSAFMTGMYQTSIGAHNHRSHREDGFTLPEGVRILPDWLRDASYFTGNIVHLTEDLDETYFRGTGKTDWAQYLNTVMSLDRKIGFARSATRGIATFATSIQRGLSYSSTATRNSPIR